MARENQDLQIALIVSVMLTIILGVATFLCYRQYTDTAKSLKTRDEEYSKKQREADAARDEISKLKHIIGVADTERIENLDTQFKDDMKKYGGAYAEESQFYRPLMEKLFQTIQDKDKELVDAKEANKQLQAKYEAREAGKDAQIKQFEETVKQVTKDLADRTEAFNKDRAQLTEDQTKIKDQLQSARKEAAAAVAKQKARNEEILAQLQKIGLAAKKLREENTSLTEQTMDKPDGQITWINQRNGTVWIDLGRADNLNPLTNFSVYPGNAADLAKSAKKAAIEVTQVLGDHLAEARILDDKIADPIMPGDKIYTPIWSPGDKRHFALAGFMDVNGDGKNNIQLLRDLITMNGGVVDCQVDEKGKKVGDLAVQTRFLVLGANPGEKGDPKGGEAFSKIMGEAENMGIQKISLSDLLDRMGYRPQAHVVKFGSGANPNDFKPKPESVQHKSTGSVSEIYKPREPSRSSAGGAF
jgi:hypothetical protein